MAPDDGPLDPTGEPLRNTALVEAMAAVAGDDRPEARALLFQLLLDATVVVPIPAVTEPGTHVATAGERLAVVIDVDDQGTVVPVFTSAEALLRWKPEGSPFAALPAAPLLEAVGAGPEVRVVVDPGSPTWGTITWPEVQALAHGRLPVTPGRGADGVRSEVVAEATSVRIGPPAELPPAALLDALAAAMASEPVIEQAYLFLMQQGDQAPELMVGVAFAPTTAGEVAEDAVHRVVATVGSAHGAARELAFLALAPDLRAALADGAGVEVHHRDG